ncbi:cytokine receptor family member b4 [Carassius auratus]|uniref:Cytokine receptor family member b4 n=1 Tax=Carassius auratus TaxID=7957 RepID=A0A6P6Q531_CARAU|nr:interleukin-10 receptor subunit beta-like [Carassius auratus]XP_052420597.1 cytokine receptor family member b4 [Carassius gibelio]WJO13310.1 interleukin-10 receptor subunit beta [Carassius cuvieri x Carassius auratus red var.]
MSASSCVSRLVLFYIFCVTAERIPAPENVRRISVNMGLVLEWDPPQNTTNTLLNYTAEMQGWSNYEPVCRSSSALSCDFTDKVSIFGSYHLRVRAELHGESSDWVETENFSLDKITEISAPHVELRSRKGQTEVDITDPPMKKKNLRHVFGNISYRIRFWKDGETKKEELIREQNRVVLPKLEPLVKYCVEVEILYLTNKSLTSNITCLTNTSSNEVESWLIAVVLLGSFLVVLFAVVLIFLAVWFGYRGCRIIFPDTDLPEDLKKFLSQQLQSSVLWAMQESTPVKEHCCELRILHKEPISSPDNQQIEGPLRIHTYKNECCTGANVKQSSEEKSQMILATEQEPLLAEMRP